MIERGQAVLTGSGFPGHAGVCRCREREREGEKQEERLEEVAGVRTLLVGNLSLKYLSCTFSDPFPAG